MILKNPPNRKQLRAELHKRKQTATYARRRNHELNKAFKKKTSGLKVGDIVYVNSTGIPGKENFHFSIVLFKKLLKLEIFSQFDQKIIPLHPEQHEMLMLEEEYNRASKDEVSNSKQTNAE